jgi:UDP-N-acetylglucosamine acyltransferase
VSIHPLAVVHPDAVVGSGVTVGPFTTVGAGVTIGDGTQVGPNAHIEGDTTLGKNCSIFHGASIGGQPQILGVGAVRSKVSIGDETVVREYVTIHRGGKDGQTTRIGNKCLLMAYVHIAHDCQVGDEVVIVNSTGLSGHVVVEDRAFISGMVGVHQFVRIGAYSMIGGSMVIRQDVLPYSLVAGPPSRLVSTNSVGLKRRGFSESVRRDLKKAFNLLLQPDLNTAQAVQRLQEEIAMGEEIRYLVNFINNSSKRGFTK